MFGLWLDTLLAVLIVSLISLIGLIGLSISHEKLNKILLYLVGVSAGGLIGDAFIHLLPEAVENYGFSLIVISSVIAGILFSYIIESVIQWKHVHHAHKMNHGKHKNDIDCKPFCSFAYMNLVGDVFHNFIDGVIIAGSFLVDFSVGVATTVAVLLHEIPQEIGDFGVLLHGGFSRFKALSLNFLTAMTAFLGAILTLLLATSTENLLEFLLPFAAGNFIYIAVSDLFPELRTEGNPKKAFFHLISVLVGIGAMFLLMGLE